MLATSKAMANAAGGVIRLDAMWVGWRLFKENAGVWALAALTNLVVAAVSFLGSPSLCCECWMRRWW